MPTVQTTRPFDRILVHNHKGGSGKTSLAVHLAWHLAEEGTPSVFLDTDMQDSATLWLSHFQWEGSDGFEVGHADETITVISHDEATATHLADEHQRPLIIDTPPNADVLAGLSDAARPGPDSVVVIPADGKMSLDGVVAVLEEIEDAGLDTRVALVAWKADPAIDAHASLIATLLHLEDTFSSATLFRLAVPPNLRYFVRAENEGIPYWGQEYAMRTHTGQALRAVCRWIERGATIADADARSLGVSDALRRRLWIDR